MAADDKLVAARIPTRPSIREEVVRWYREHQHGLLALLPLDRESALGVRGARLGALKDVSDPIRASQQPVERSHVVLSEARVPVCVLLCT